MHNLIVVIYNLGCFLTVTNILLAIVDRKTYQDELFHFIHELRDKEIPFIKMLQEIFEIKILMNRYYARLSLVGFFMIVTAISYYCQQIV